MTITNTAEALTLVGSARERADKVLATLAELRSIVETTQVALAGAKQETDHEVVVLADVIEFAESVIADFTARGTAAGKVGEFEVLKQLAEETIGQIEGGVQQHLEQTHGHLDGALQLFEETHGLGEGTADQLDRVTAQIEVLQG